MTRGMHTLDGRHAQTFNDRHGRLGHLFQGRFHAQVVATTFTSRRRARTSSTTRCAPVSARSETRGRGSGGELAYAQAWTGDSAGAHEQIGETSPPRPFSRR